MSPERLAAGTPLTGHATVLDTNVVLDLLVFGDKSTDALKQMLALGRLRWLATSAMRQELARVLAYPQIERRLAEPGLAAQTVLNLFDRQSQAVPAAPRAPLTCEDPDDQMFVDLAVANRCLLISKDQAVLKLKRHLLSYGVQVTCAEPSDWADFLKANHG